MKRSAFLSLIAAAILFSGCNQKSVDQTQSINPVLGDISFVHKFGHNPDRSTNNELRIITHLEYVENLLRKKDVASIPAGLKKKRENLLDMLHKYWTTGAFPKNYDHPGQRKPCFIDKDNTICAVGYLIEQTAGRETAENINRKHKYDELLAMNDETVDMWVASSGLTKEECAMIQPTYGPPPPQPDPTYSYNHISKSYGVSTSVLSGVNLSLNALNGIQIIKGANGKAIPVVGLLTGIGQIVLGASNFPEETINWDGMNTTNEKQRTISMINIGLGTTSVILSAWNLITNRQQKNKRTSWNIYSFPTQDNNTGVAFSLTRKF